MIADKPERRVRRLSPLGLISYRLLGSATITFQAHSSYCLSGSALSPPGLSELPR
jgi:hypothetical protein